MPERREVDVYEGGYEIGVVSRRNGTFAVAISAGDVAILLGNVRNADHGKRFIADLEAVLNRQTDYEAEHIGEVTQGIDTVMKREN